jgi:hypothetical protein
VFYGDVNLEVDTITGDNELEGRRYDGGRGHRGHGRRAGLEGVDRRRRTQRRWTATSRSLI